MAFHPINSLRSRTTRRGKATVLLAIMLPALLGVAGLVLDGGLMTAERRILQHAVDAAATAAAADLQLGKTTSDAMATASATVLVDNRLVDADLTVNIPPSLGPFTGRSGYVEVIGRRSYANRLMKILNGITSNEIEARAVAGVDDVTSGAVIAVLDPDPGALVVPSGADVMSEVDGADMTTSLGLQAAIDSVNLGGLQNAVRAGIVDAVVEQLDELLAEVAADVALPATPTLIAGLEVEGLGRLAVDGAILVNTEWGGVDENGDPAGTEDGPPYAVSCTPLLPLTSVLARDLRVVGGVDDEGNYANFAEGEATPLRANRLPTPDPLVHVKPPTSANSGASTAIVQGGHKVHVNLLSTGPILQGVLQPLLGPLWTITGPGLVALLKPVLDPLLVQTSLKPGVYDSITAISLGEVYFEPGVYIIRGKHPQTQISLLVAGGWIRADNVLFYVTNAADYDPSTGLPDSADDRELAPPNLLGTTQPSVLLAPILPGSSISGWNSPGSPLDGILLYQRPADRRPIVIAATKLVGGGQVSGTIYSRWGHVLFQGGLGTYDLRFVTGTLRVVALGDAEFAPAKLLPPAQDVLHVE